MKHLLTTMLLLLPGLSFSQDLIFNPPNKKQVDSLQSALRHEHRDTSKMFIYDQLGSYNIENNTAKAINYLKEELVLARKLVQQLWEAKALENLSYSNYLIGNYLESLRLANAGIAITEGYDCEKGAWKVNLLVKDGDAYKARMYLLAGFYEKLGYLYAITRNNDKSLASYAKAIQIAKSVDDKVGLSFYYGDLDDYYLQKGKLDSALIFINLSLQNSQATNYRLYRGALLADLGQIYFLKANYTAAKKYYFESIKANKELSNRNYLLRTYLLLADLYRSTGKTDSGIYYAKAAMSGFQAQDNRPGINQAYSSLFATYNVTGQKDSAFVYLQRSKILSDSLHLAEITKINQYLNEGFNDQLKVEQLEKEKLQEKTRVRTYILLTGIFIVLLIALLLYRNNLNRKKANIILTQQKEKVESALARLKTAQDQLIQSAKMAYLGELTAGIAHEIQNPLNFVNNFSEVNKEMLEELKAESKKPKTERDEEVEAGLINDLIDNETKINHHGKRADSIVKGMLEHSRVGTGEKQLTDLNSLADEYLRLSYHGVRAKDKEFHAEIVTNFDAGLPNVNIAPQDISRVLLNLFNNAFYAVNQKSKTAGPDYKPTVEVITAQPSGSIMISVKDNGNGIPDAIKDKIMQPFFTTKPTGEGIGLGLSLSYDIVVKRHGGNISMNSILGEATEFTISLPANSY